MHSLNADLHSHSIHSDGTLTPQAVAERAKSRGVELWALTDHDTLSGQAEAAGAARSLGLDWLSGVEISVSFAGQTVHVVGLGVDPDDDALAAGLAAIRSGRIERARAIGDALGAAGLSGAYDGARALASNPELVTRTHFARWLVETGVCADTGDVFRHYLKRGKPGYVPHRWASLGEAVRWITGAGGIAVVAHPGRYKYTPTEEHALFSEFKGHGGGGVEVLTGSHGAAEQVKYGEIAREFDLMASRGSDFHSPDESRTDLGTLPALPAALTPVWLRLLQRA